MSPWGTYGGLREFRGDRNLPRGGWQSNSIVPASALTCHYEYFGCLDVLCKGGLFKIALLAPLFQILWLSSVKQS